MDSIGNQIIDAIKYFAGRFKEDFKQVLNSE